MHTNRTQLVCISLAAIVVLAAVALSAVRPRHVTASKRDFDRIEIGMSREQVEQILGSRPGDYRTAKPDLEASSNIYFQHWDQWQGDEGTILVFLDGNGRVREREFREPRPPSEPSFLAIFTRL
jgi:hypothetical protein